MHDSLPKNVFEPALRPDFSPAGPDVTYGTKLPFVPESEPQAQRRIGNEFVHTTLEYQTHVFPKKVRPEAAFPRSNRNTLKGHAARASCDGSNNRRNRVQPRRAGAHHALERGDDDLA